MVLKKFSSLFSTISCLKSTNKCSEFKCRFFRFTFSVSLFFWDLSKQINVHAGCLKSARYLA